MITLKIILILMTLLFIPTVAIYEYKVNKRFRQWVIGKLTKPEQQPTKLIETEHQSPLIDWINGIHSLNMYEEVEELIPGPLTLELNWTLFNKIKDRPVNFTFETIPNHAKSLPIRHMHILNNSQLRFPTHQDLQRFLNGL